MKFFFLEIKLYLSFNPKYLPQLWKICSANRPKILSRPEFISHIRFNIHIVREFYFNSQTFSRTHNVVNNLWHSRFSSLFHQTKKFSTKVHFYRTFLCWYYFQITFLILLFWREQKLFFRNKSKRRLNFFHFTRYGEFLLLIVADEDLRTALRAAGGLRNFESIFRANLQWVGSLTQMQRLNLSSSGKQPLAGNSCLCNCP